MDDRNAELIVGRFLLAKAEPRRTCRRLRPGRHAMGGKGWRAIAVPHRAEGGMAWFNLRFGAWTATWTMARTGHAWVGRTTLIGDHGSGFPRRRWRFARWEMGRRLMGRWRRRWTMPCLGNRR